MLSLKINVAENSDLENYTFQMHFGGGYFSEKILGIKECEHTMTGYVTWTRSISQGLPKFSQ